MKKLFLLCLFCGISNLLLAQKETFDVVSYTAPKKTGGISWIKEVTETNISYTIVNKKDNSWCRIGIIKSTISKGSIDDDFQSEWQELIVKLYKPSEPPQLNEVKETEEWKIKAGGAKFTFNNSQAIAILTTATGYNRCVSIVAITNSQNYIKDIEALLLSVDLIKPDVHPVQQQTALPQTPNTNNDKNSVIGTWGKGNSVTQPGGSFGRWSYTKEQYIFNQSGTYIFARKVYVEDNKETLLTRETGTYTISGNRIIIDPKTNVIEAWSKINGGDNFKQLISSQKQPLENTTYQFTVQYNTELKDTFLLLMADKETARDGLINTNSIAWRYGPTPPFIPIKMPN